MRVVYIAGPFGAPNAWLIEQNIRRAEEAALYVAELGAAPLCPHTNTRFFHGTCTAQFWYDATLTLLERSDALYLVRGWQESRGSVAEYDVAMLKGLPIFYHEETLKHGEPSPLALWIRKEI